jgi:hypothetical protein
MNDAVYQLLDTPLLFMAWKITIGEGALADKHLGFADKRSFSG